MGYNKKVILLFTSIFILITNIIGFTVDAADINKFKDNNIENFLEDTMKKSKIPNMDIAIIKDDDISFLSFSNFGKKLVKKDKNMLYEIGSNTKAFTAFGILMLEDEGKISLDDPVSNYIPWFKVKYNGAEVKSEDLTIANLLYQTSGFTNDEIKYPSAKDKMSIYDNVKMLSGSDLSFYPSEKYSYANANYNILGLIIEYVSHQSYEEFMINKVLKPLGLNNTYVNSKEAELTNNLIDGSRLSFLHDYKYSIPIVKGNIPAGYIISSTNDLSRWMNIQMGNIKISEQTDRIIKKSHDICEKSQISNKTYYGAGWFIDKSGLIYHSGGTPNYSSRIIINRNRKIGVCVLTNINASANTDYIADNLYNILIGNPINKYHHDVWYIVDIIFTAMTVLSLAGIIYIIIKMIKLKKINSIKTRKKKILLSIIPIIEIILSLLLIILIPVMFKSTWHYMYNWAPFSLFSGVILFSIMSLITALYVSMMIRHKKRNC